MLRLSGRLSLGAGHHDASLIAANDDIDAADAVRGSSGLHEESDQQD
ncbi:hypothetical protein [Microbacterium aurugineum]|nr:hypothetical protein [Microbacterium aurugineum]MCK8477913.1 hypothetical protein [Microbacterium aurugineum]